MSAPYSARDAVEWTEGVLLQGRTDTSFSGTSIDTRTVGSGVLFVAIVGEKHDAHCFIDDAVVSSASGLLVERGHAALDGKSAIPRSMPIIAVRDTTRALGALAAGHRNHFEGPVVAVTGSNGKTTTKEMCASILSQRAPCLKNAGNLNNQFGLPLTLLRRETSHESAVVELGMNHRGEIAELAAIAKPGVGVVTNVGTAHIEYLGSIDEIAREKGDLVAALPKDGTAVLNADDPRVETLARRSRAQVLLFGRRAEADVRGEFISLDEDGALHFELSCRLGSCDVAVEGIGDATLENALAAAGAALAAGASLDDIVRGLRAYRPVAGRLSRIDLPGDVVILDDTYNANPQSMENALRALVALPRSRHIAVLGPMGELGDDAEEAHTTLGRLAAQLEIDTVFAVGEHAQKIIAGAQMEEEED